MELVYLWVEEYKNIIGQGFNFSPRFECSYDEEKEELTINENKDYVSIFPENINVTAIVGENGSRKSNLLELIFFPFQIQEDNSNRYIAFFKEEKYIYSYCSYINNYEPKLNKNFNHKILLDSDITDKINPKFISGLLRRYKNDRIDVNIRKTSEHNKGNMTYEQSIIVKSLYLFSKNININIKDKNISFTNLNIKLTKLPLDNITISSEIDEVFKEYINEFGIESKSEFNNKIESFEILFTKNILISLIDYYSIFELDGTKHSFFDIFNEDFKTISLTLIYSFINPEIHDDLAYLVDLSIKLLEQLKKFNFEIEYKGSREIAYKVNFNISENESILTNLINDYSVFIKRFSESYYEFQMLEIDLLMDNELKLSSLSEGENKIFSTLIDFKYEFLFEKENYLLILDEPDNYLHPNWVKEFISILLKNTNNIKKDIQVIITSHSPFILSDLPKENVIFLENGKQVYPFKDNEQTFGANIHTLLSHGFFMEDGLMGEFAKNKISEVIKLLNSKRKLSKKNQKFCKHIISIIGEPILQKTLEHQLNEKLNPNETELQKLEREQEEIKAKIDKLKRENNETN